MAVYLIGKKDIDIDNDIDNVYAIEVNNSHEYFNVIGSLNALEEVEFWNETTSLNDYPVSMCEYFGIPMIENATVDNVEHFPFLPRTLEVKCGVPKDPSEHVKILEHGYSGDTICISPYIDSDFLCVNGKYKPNHEVLLECDNYTVVEVSFPIDCFAEDNILTEITNEDKYETVGNGLEDMVNKYFRNLGRRKKRSV